MKANKHNLLRATVAIGAIGATAAVSAAPITYSYETTIGFDPTSTVGIGGQNAGQLIDEIYGAGIGSTGSASVSGQFTYDSSVGPIHTTSVASNYTAAITSSTLTLGSSTTNANVNAINNNGSSSFLGYTDEPGATCTTATNCDDRGAPFIGTGNLIYVTNNTDVELNDVLVKQKDGLDFAIGGTDVENDFNDPLSTDTFGDVYVDYVILDLFSKTNRDFFDSGALTTLPENLTFLNDKNLKQSVFFIGFSGEQLNDRFTLEGTLSKLNGRTVDVPEPNALAILGLGLLCLVGVSSRRKRGE